MCMLHIALCVGMAATIPFDFGFLTMNPGAANFASHRPMFFDHQLETISRPKLRLLTRVLTNA